MSPPPSITAPETTPNATAHPAATTRPAALVLLGILLVAINLRAAITSLGALLGEVGPDLHLSGVQAGLVTTLPTISFAVFGAVTPWLTRRLGHAQLLVASMVVLAAGQLVRVLGDSVLIFITTSTLALAGIAVANVLLPVLVREYFPHRAGLITGVYTMTLVAGASAGAAASVPMAHALGSWRAGLGIWGLLAIGALVPWLRPALQHRRASQHRRALAASESAGQAKRAGNAGSTTAPTARPAIPRPRVGRTRLGWAMAVYFGAQSLSGYAVMGWLAQIFRDASYPPTDAGLLLAGVAAIGVPIALLMPTLAARRGDVRPLVVLMSAAMMAAYIGLALAPGWGSMLWVALLGVGQGAFPLALVMIGMRSRTREGTVALSAFAQSTGYLIASLGPLSMGVLYGMTGAWTVPLGFLLVAAVIQLIAGLFAGKPRFVEDE